MRYTLEIPATLEEAFEIRKKTDGTYLAAGTVILVNHCHAKTLVSLEKIPGLNSIKEASDCIRIGSNVTFDDLENSELIKCKAYALWQAACSVGGPQIRNRATIGGNVACFSVSSDGVTPLIALGAVAVVYDGAGFSEIPVEELVPFKNGEIITEFVIPCTGGCSVFEKVGKRNALAVSQINIAVAKVNGKVRVAVGCAGPSVIFCRKTSELLSEGYEKIEEASKAILSEIKPHSETAQYKNAVCVNLLEKLAKEVCR